MIKKKETLNKKPEIDITGPDGNAFVLLGHAVSLYKQLNINKNKVLAEMQSGDYENLVAVFNKYFGRYIDIVRD